MKRTIAFLFVAFSVSVLVMRLADKDHSWAALGRLIPDMLAAGLIGCPYICPDMVGGGQWRADDGRVHDGPAEISVETPLSRISHFMKERCSSGNAVTPM